MEIARLADQVRTLTDRLLIAVGKPEATSPNLTTDEPEDEPVDPEPTQEEQDVKAAKALEALASERGLTPLDYADA